MWTLPDASPARLLSISQRLDDERLVHAFGGSIALEAWGIPGAGGDAELHVFAEASQRETAIASLGLVPTSPKGGGTGDAERPVALLESTRSRRTYKGIQIPVLGAEAIVALTLGSGDVGREALLARLIASRGFAFDDAIVRKHLPERAIARFDALLEAAARTAP